MFRTKTRKAEALTIEGRLSFTGNGDALLVLPDDALILAPDPWQSTPPAGEPAHHYDSPTLDLLAERLGFEGRLADLADAILGRPIENDDAELVDVRITIERR